MLIKMEFSHPEDKEQFEDCYRGSDYKAVLQNMDNFLRNKLKYDHELSEEAKAIFQEVRDNLYSIADMFEVEIYE